MTTIIKLKIFPSSAETKIEKVEEKIREKLKQLESINIHSFEKEDIAFGLKVLVLTVLIPDEFSPSTLEEKIKEIDEVSNIEVVDCRRALA